MPSGPRRSRNRSARFKTSKQIDALCSEARTEEFKVGYLLETNYSRGALVFRCLQSFSSAVYIFILQLYLRSSHADQNRACASVSTTSSAAFPTSKARM